MVTRLNFDPSHATIRKQDVVLTATLKSLAREKFKVTMLERQLKTAGIRVEWIQVGKTLFVQPELYPEGKE